MIGKWCAFICGIAVAGTLDAAYPAMIQRPIGAGIVYIVIFGAAAMWPHGSISEAQK